jgi:hypothetical protein
LRSDGGLDRAGAVCGGNAGGDAFGGFDGYGERGAVEGAVARSHRWQAQVFAALARQRQADQSAAETRHEVDGLGRDMVSRQHQVAFVLAIFFVDQDDHAPGAHLGHDVFHRGDGDGGRLAHAVSLRVTDSSGPNMRST